MANYFKEYLTIKENELLDIDGECILCEEDFCDEIYKGIRTSQYQDSFDYILCKLEDDVQIVQVIRVYDDDEYEVIIIWVFGVIGVDHRRQVYWVKIKT